MGESVNEDTSVLPDAWRRHLHPRRGGVPGIRVKIDGKVMAPANESIAGVRARRLDAALSGVATTRGSWRRFGAHRRARHRRIGAAALARRG
jgi:hypothetical protein